MKLIISASRLSSIFLFFTALYCSFYSPEDHYYVFNLFLISLLALISNNIARKRTAHFKYINIIFSIVGLLSVLSMIKNTSFFSYNVRLFLYSLFGGMFFYIFIINVLFPLYEFFINISNKNQNLKKPEPQDQAELNRINTELEQANATIQQQKEQIAELEKQLEQAKRAEGAVKSDDVLTQPKQERISQPKRDLFSLLVLKNYQDYQSRNALFDAINADMKEHGIRTNDIKYPTLDNLIDDNLRINGLSIFPSKQK